MMKRVDYPPVSEWEKLVQRPDTGNEDIDATVRQVLEEVRTGGDRAVAGFNSRFDGFASSSFEVPGEMIEAGTRKLAPALKSSIELAAYNIEKFHRSQLEEPLVTETSPGVRCWSELRPIESVGIYIPGGTAPLFSTVMMLAIPARIAGCSEIILATPPGRDGVVDPAILFAASLCGVRRIFRVGGAQAIAAMAYGTETIPRVLKIFGPGNRYVTRAKEMVQLSGTAIDMPAGPSELRVIADSGSDATYVAADLLSKAEHGSDSQVILLSDDEGTIEAVVSETARQLKYLPRREFAEKALESSYAILLGSVSECIHFSNIYAPEHLVLATRDYMSLVSSVQSAGSVFLGRYSCESAGDYASGTNHTLPTNGHARTTGGVSTASFMKRITFQELSLSGLKYIGEAIETMALAEGLYAHKNAVSVRLKENDNV